MVWLEQHALQNAEPDLDLIEPRSVRGHRENLNAQFPTIDLALLLQPVFQWLGRMGSTVVLDQGHGVHAASQNFGHDHLQQESLEINNSFPLATHPIHQSINHAQGSKEMQSSVALIAVRDATRCPGTAGSGACGLCRAWIEVFSSAQTVYTPCCNHSRVSS